MNHAWLYSETNEMGGDSFWNQIGKKRTRNSF